MRVGKLLVQNKEVQNKQRTKTSELAEVPGNNDLGFFPEGLSRISLLLPVASNGRCGSAGIAANQISGSNGACEVGALGQMLTLLSAGEDAGMSAWCGCRPAGDALTAFEVERKSPTSVDSCDPLHGHPKGSEHVSDDNFLFADLNPGKPKEHQGSKDYGQNQGSAQKHSRDAIGGEDAGQSQHHGQHDGNREVSRGLSNENLHVTSVAVNEKGLCLNDL